MRKKLISIISGCYNEEGNLWEYYQRVSAVMDSLLQYDFECLIADNCSKDSSQQILEEIAAKDKRFKIVFNLKNYGPDRSGGNLLYRAKGDALIIIPTDLQDPPEMIPIFLESWEEGNKLVWGQRTGSQESGFMRLVRKAYYRIIAGMSESEEAEQANGFGLYDREIVDWIKKAGDPVPFVRNLVTSFGYKPVLIPYERRRRNNGHSSYTLLRYFNDAYSGMVASTRRPLRFASYFGFFTAGIAILFAIIYFVMKMTKWYEFPAGTAPLLIGMFFLGAVQLICVGILGEYIGDILIRVRHRPMVIERTTINFVDDSDDIDGKDDLQNDSISQEEQDRDNI